MIGPKHVRDAISRLAQNFDEYVEEYRKEKYKQFEEGKTEDLEKELVSIKNYLDIYYEGKVSDTIENINFYDYKQAIIEKILVQKE